MVEKLISVYPVNFIDHASNPQVLKVKFEKTDFDNLKRCQSIVLEYYLIEVSIRYDGEYTYLSNKYDLEPKNLEIITNQMHVSADQVWFQAYHFPSESVLISDMISIKELMGEENV